MGKWFFVVVLISLLALCCTGPVGPPGEEGLTDPAIQPEVIYSFPSNESQGPYPDFNNRVAIRFNKIMDHTSMKNAVTLSSAAGDVVFDTSTVGQNSDAFSLGGMNPQGRSLGFKWKLGQAYTLTIDSMTMDVNGNHFHHPFSTTFTPEPYFRVVSISPVNGTTEIGLSSSIRLTFNSQVDTSIFSKIHITPQLSGTWGYVQSFPTVDSTVVLFSYFNAIVDTTYTVTIDGTAKDKYGNQMVHGFSSSFTTVTFRLASTTPANGNTGVPVSSTIKVGFSIPIDTGTVRQSFSIFPNFTGVFSLIDGSSSFTFRPLKNKRLLANTTYSVTISTGIAAKAGMHLAQPYSFNFTTAPFAVSSTSPATGSTDINVPSSIFISFNDLIDTGSVRQAFSISPKVSGVFQLIDSTSSFTFLPDNPLLTNTAYSVTISTAMLSRAGDHLLQPYNLSFSTSAFALTGNSPGHGSTNVDLTSLIQISFSDIIDTGSVRAAFSVTPPLSGTLNIFDNTNSFSFIPNNGLSANTSYTVRLSTALRSKSGDTLAAPVTFTFITAPFLITSAYPPNGGINVGYSTIDIYCNGSVDAGSVGSAFSISPDISGAFQVNPYPGNSAFFFIPDHQYSPGTTYTVTVSTALKTLAGDTLSAPYRFAFTTIPFTVTNTYPPNGSINQSISDVIRIDFSAPVDTTGLFQAITFSPPINAIISATEGNSSVYYYPIDPLSFNTQYTVNVSTAIRAIGGVNLKSPYTFSFKTVPFQVTYTTPTEGQANVPRSTIIALTFSAEIDTGSVRSSFSISPPVIGTLTAYEGTSYFTFAPNSFLAANTEYTVSVSAAMKSKNGTPLVAPFSFSFATGN